MSIPNAADTQTKHKYRANAYRSDLHCVKTRNASQNSSLAADLAELFRRENHGAGCTNPFLLKVRASRERRCFAFLPLQVYLKQASACGLGDREKGDLVKRQEHRGESSRPQPQRLPMALTFPPSAADKTAFIFQTVFIKIVREPLFNKMDPRRPVPEWALDLLREALLETATASRAFQPLPGEHFGEENMRPWMINLILGICKMFRKQDKVCCAMGSVRYYVKVTHEDGRTSHEPVSPPVLDVIAMHEETGSDTRKFWKQDAILYIKLRLLVDDDWIEDYVPVKYIEMKHDEAEQDIWQAVLTACNFQVSRIKELKPVSRIYVEVWNGSSWQYGILDLFGLIEVRNGQIEEDAYEFFLSQVEKQRKVMGDHFPEDTFAQCPQTLDEMRRQYEITRNNFRIAFSEEMPNFVVPSAYPVGTLYLDLTRRPLPGGQHPVEEQEAARFICGFIACLLGNKALAFPCDFIQGWVQNRVQLLAEVEKHLVTRNPRPCHYFSPGMGAVGPQLDQLAEQLREKDAEVHKLQRALEHTQKELRMTRGRYLKLVTDVTESEKRRLLVKCP